MNDEERMCYEYNQERIDIMYYIDTDGKIHKYKGDMYEEIVSIHAEIARALFLEITNPDDYVMKIGWILVGSSCYHHPIIHRKPTQAQINTLDRINQLDRATILENGYFVKLKDSKQLQY